MTRSQLEHLIRAASSIVGDQEIIVIGSQAVLGQFPNAPAELLVSNEADLYPRNYPERAALIEGSIGELSPFHETFGYYAEGVAEETATLPRGWETRLVAVPVGEARGLCLEIHDLVLSKYAAGREKDRDFVRVAVRHGLVAREVLLDRIPEMAVAADRRAVLRAFIEADFGCQLPTPDRNSERGGGGIAR